MPDILLPAIFSNGSPAHTFLRKTRKDSCFFPEMWYNKPN